VTLLTDLAMPLMDGTTLVDLWRRIEDVTPDLERAHIIVVSATHLNVRPPGVDAVLEKPLTLDQLQRQLA
jgi:CheY-like chemotaxis protein